MSCRALRGLVLVLGLWAAAALAVERGQPQEPRHLLEAKALVTAVPLEKTSYQHGKEEIVWAVPGECHADCSGFIGALLQHSYGYDVDSFRRWFDSTRPSAARFHDTIEQGRGFAVVERVADIQPGDILAVKYLTRRENTGHVMLAAAAPEKLPAGEPAVPGTEQWSVAIIDSSQSGHGTTDRRYRTGAGGKDHEGLGAGVLRIYSDAQGRVAGYTWSTYRGSKFIEPKDQHLVIGRIVPGFRP